MRTKTGELLMRKKLESAAQNKQLSPPRAQPPPQPHPASPFLALSPHPRHTHISHVNDFTYVCQTNRNQPKQDHSGEVLREMEIQNLRLIESNMRVVEWAQNLVSSLRQSILRVIDTIEDFKYLEAVNKLHQTLAEMTDYQESVSLPPLPHRAPPSIRPPKTVLCPQIYSLAFHSQPHSDSDEQQQRAFPEAHTRQEHFSRQDSYAQDNSFCGMEKGEGGEQQQMWEMLVMQGMVIEQYVHLLEQQSN